METKAQKAAERIRKVTWDYIREHGVLHIEDNDHETSYKEDLTEILDDVYGAPEEEIPQFAGTREALDKIKIN